MQIANPDLTPQYCFSKVEKFLSTAEGMGYDFRDFDVVKAEHEAKQKVEEKEANMSVEQRVKEAERILEEATARQKERLR